MLVFRPVRNEQEVRISDNEATKRFLFTAGHNTKVITVSTREPEGSGAPTSHTGYPDRRTL